MSVLISTKKRGVFKIQCPLGMQHCLRDNCKYYTSEGSDRNCLYISKGKGYKKSNIGEDRSEQRNNSDGTRYKNRR